MCVTATWMEGKLYRNSKAYSVRKSILRKKIEERKGRIMVFGVILERR